MPNVISFTQSELSKRSRVVRDTIVRALVELITEEGFAGITTKRVAERAGVSTALVEKQMGTKAKQLKVILQYCNEEFLALINHEALRDGSLEDRVILLVNLSWHHCKTDLFLARLEVLTATRSYRDASLLEALSKQQAEAMRLRVREIFPECGLDDRALMESLISTHSYLTGLVIQTLIEPQLANVGGYLRRASRAMLVMLEAKNQT